MKRFHNRPSTAFLLALAALLAGCNHDTAPPTPTVIATTANVVDLDAAIAKAGNTRRPLVLLIGEFGPNGADQSSHSLLDDPSIKTEGDGIDFITIDLSISRNRATAARYHITDTPMLVCLAPSGLIVSRDVKPIPASLVVQRIDELQARAGDLEDKLARLQLGAAKNTPDTNAESRLAYFLLAQQNDREAIPHLQIIADFETAPLDSRVRSWVELARAHLWIAEPEKARHTAKALIAMLGPITPQAIAGGNLVLGLQDAAAKRFALARQEFNAAIAAAPDSDYATEAKQALTQLPKEDQ